MQNLSTVKRAKRIREVEEHKEESTFSEDSVNTDQQKIVSDMNSCTTKELQQHVELSKSFLLLAYASRVPNVSLSDAVPLLTMTGKLVIEFGKYDMPNQQRLHKHGNLDWRPETRKHWATVYGEFKHPKINNIKKDIKFCAKSAATTAVIAAVATENPALGMELFYPAFKLRLITKISERVVNEIDVRLYAENEYSSWTNHRNQVNGSSFEIESNIESGQESVTTFRIK